MKFLFMGSEQAKPALGIAILLDIPMLDLIDLVNQLKESQLLVNSIRSR